MSMLHDLCLSQLVPNSRCLLERALTKLPKGTEVTGHFSNKTMVLGTMYQISSTEADRTTVLNKVNKEQRSCSISTWLHVDDVFSLPNEVVMSSNEDLYHPKPNYYRLLFVGVEHQNKVIRRALVDQGWSINTYEIGQFDDGLQVCNYN